CGDRTGVSGSRLTAVARGRAARSPVDRTTERRSSLHRRAVDVRVGSGEAESLVERDGWGVVACYLEERRVGAVLDAPLDQRPHQLAGYALATVLGKREDVVQPDDPAMQCAEADGGNLTGSFGEDVPLWVGRFR